MNKKILVVLTNHNSFDGCDDPTGLWLSELTHFYHILHEMDYGMDFISPQGGRIPIDPRSLGFPFLDKETNTYFNNRTFMQKLDNSFSPDQVNAEDYVAIYFTGGHGTLWDFPDNTELQDLSCKIYEAGGVVSAVCHGNAALLNIKLSDGKSLIEGRSITGFSNAEEIMARKRKYVPFLLEDEIRKRGANYKKAMLPLVSFKQIDGRLITGQNPSSSRAVAKALVELLAEMQPEDANV